MKSPLRILLVEDEAPVRQVITLYLGRDGHNVTVAANGKEGLNQFRLGNFDLVILDRVMPEMGGEQLAQHIKKTSPKMPIILLSGTADLCIPEDHFPEGIDAVINKPVPLDELRKAIARLRPVPKSQS